MVHPARFLFPLRNTSVPLPGTTPRSTVSIDGAGARDAHRG
jgi:hypothetical protein